MEKLAVMDDAIVFISLGEGEKPLRHTLLATSSRDGTTCRIPLASNHVDAMISMFHLFTNDVLLSFFNYSYFSQILSCLNAYISQILFCLNAFSAAPLFSVLSAHTRLRNTGNVLKHLSMRHL